MNQEKNLWFENHSDFKFNTSLPRKIKAVLGMLGDDENMSENLSSCLFALGISLLKGGEGERQTELISVRGGRLPVGVPADALAHTAELVVILTACSIFL